MLASFFVEDGKFCAIGRALKFEVKDQRKKQRP